MHGRSISLLVNDELPVPTLRRSRSEVLEIKGENREIVTLGVSHKGGVDETEAKIPVPRVYLRGAAYQALGHELDRVFPVGHRAQKGSPRIAVHARPQKLVDFDNDRIQNHELSSQLRHQGGCQIMSAVPAIRRGNDGSRIGQDPQSLETNSRR
jgi:hypothetical protein